MRQEDIDKGNFETPDGNGDAGNKDIIPDDEVGVETQDGNNVEPEANGVETKVETNRLPEGDVKTQGDGNEEHKVDGAKTQEDNIVEAEKNGVETQGDTNRQLKGDEVEIEGGNKVEPIEEPEVNGEETQGDNNVESEKNGAKTKEDDNVEHEENVVKTQDNIDEQPEENDDDFEEHPDIVDSEDTNLNKPDVGVNNDEVKQGSLPDEPYKVRVVWLF